MHDHSHPHSHTEDHGHHHGHHHGHAHAVPDGDGMILLAVVVNLALTVAQIAGGWWADSTALMADGVHNLSDALALILAFGARRFARRGATAAMTWGFGRAETIAAFVNYITLIGISLWLAVEAAFRIMSPPPVEGGMVMALAGLALVIDLATAALIYRQSQDSQNIRAAFLHNVADAAASVAVLVGGVMIWAFGWMWADPVMTILISALILWHVWGDLPGVVRILMLGAPPHLDRARIAQALVAVDGVTDAHHIHLWQIDERRVSLEAHLKLAEGADYARCLGAAKAVLAAEFGIDHSTLEIEPSGMDCVSPSTH